MKEIMQNVRKAIMVEWLSVLWMIVEAAVAVTAAVAAHSLSLMAFGLDSVLELISGFILLWRLYVEARGASTERVETVERRSAGIIGGLLLLLGLYILVTAGWKLLHHQGAQTSWLGLGLAIASGLLMPALANAKIRLGNTIGSAALRADGACSKVCGYMAWTVLAGVGLNALLRWWWIDSLAALVIVYYIVGEGWEAIQEARGIEDDD